MHASLPEFPLYSQLAASGKAGALPSSLPNSQDRFRVGHANSMYSWPIDSHFPWELLCPLA